MTKLSDIVYETGDYWVMKVKTGFEVYKVGATHSTRCAIIGWTGKNGLNKAIAEANKRDSRP